MTSQEKIKQLQSIIDANLRSFINRDYYLLEVPYYTNVGDTLIWQGELDYLKTFPYKCLGMSSYESLKCPTIKRNALIIFQGGGNFGDIWTLPHDYRLKIVKENPQHEFLFMPQTVYFKNEENLVRCANFLKKYNATICARDKVSYEILKKHFQNNILLVPDMAFYIDTAKWKKSTLSSKPLLFKRRDVELSQTEYLSSLEKLDLDIRDWPTMENKLSTMDKLKSITRKISKKIPACFDIYDWFCQNIYRQYMVACGVKFLSAYSEIYTTRLHGAILSTLLNIKTTFIDNSYGKNRTFYDTWLSDCDSIIMK